MSGAILTDREIANAIAAKEIVITDIDSNFGRLGKNGPVQPCSLDLTIGEIFVPGVESSASDKKIAGEWGFRLEPGHTVFVETRETISLPAQFGCFGFPPASVSKNAILMTNPGHVDPGFSGKLSFTLINMGRESYSLKRGDRIVTLLVFRFSEPVEADYESRKGGRGSTQSSSSTNESRLELLNRLAPDFAAYGSRISREARLAGLHPVRLTAS